MSAKESWTSPLVKIAAMAVIISAVVGAKAGMFPTVHPSKAIARPCPDCGMIDSIKVEEVKGEGTGAGGIAGAVAGNEIGKNPRKSGHYKIIVRMNNGGIRTLTQQGDPGFRPGDSVRVVNGDLVRG